MKKFFRELLSGSSSTSSKRFAAILTLVNIIIIAYIAAYNSPNKTLPQYMWVGLITIVGAGLGLTVVEKLFGKGSNDSTPPSNDEQQ